MARVDQINELLQKELAMLIAKELPIRDFMITVCYVDCSPNLSYARIGVSVLPEKFYGTALEALRKNTKLFTKILTKKLKIRNIPKISWVIDKTEKEAGEMDEFLKKIKEEDGNEKM